MLSRVFLDLSVAGLGIKKPQALPEVAVMLVIPITRPESVDDKSMSS